MAKPKLNVKDLFLRKGEFIALGIAGGGLVILLLWGVMTGLGAEDPDKISKDLSTKAQSIQSALSRNDPKADDAVPPPLPDWVGKQSHYNFLPPQEFSAHGLLFDPIAKPDMKRENPNVLGIRNYQVDLVRAPMKAYDITYDDPPKIAVRVTKTKGKFDKRELSKIGTALRTKIKDGSKRYKDRKKKAARPMAFLPGGMFPDPGGMLPGPGSPDGAMPPGAIPGMEGDAFGFGMGEGGFDLSAQRTETAITYVPLDALDQSIGEGKLPAMTAMPLRMVVINAEYPFKEQLEEVKRAMRLRTAAEAIPFVRFDGFNVRRRVSYTKSNGETTIVQPWADYDYVGKYIEVINARKLADYFEGSNPDRPRDAYLPYFYRYEDALVMPLPELVTELGSYPEIKLPSITATIDKMIDAATPKYEASELVKRITKTKPTGGNSAIFQPRTANTTGGSQFFDQSNFMSPTFDPMMMNMPGGMGEGVMPMVPQIDIEHILLRFIDCDVKPGFTYEYQIQVQMMNPNYGREQEKYVANPVMARTRSLTGPWVQLQGALTVPNESFIFAYDVAKYRNDTETDFKDQKELYKRIQVSDNPPQAVVQAASWLEEVRTESGNQREPIGGWVLAEMPVSRGAFIGRKTYVKLPLWSAEVNQYVLREMPANSVVKGGSKDQPKGWLVDFASRSILVDFEGGRSKIRAGNRPYDEDVATEMLIVRPDGKYEVRNSAADMEDPNRVKLTEDWNKWIQTVETRRLPGPGMGSDNPFERLPGSPPGP